MPGGLRYMKFERVKEPIWAPRPEWVSVNQACQWGGFSKGLLYSWLNKGLIRNVALRERGRIKGKRLISFDSLREFLESRATGGNHPTFE